MKKLLALAVELILAACASAHGVPVLRSHVAQVVVPYQPVVQVQAIPVAVHGCDVRAAVLSSAYPVVVEQVQANVYNVVQVRQPVVLRQQVIQVRQRAQVIQQRQVIRSRTVIR